MNTSDISVDNIRECLQTATDLFEWTNFHLNITVTPLLLHATAVISGPFYVYGFDGTETRLRNLSIVPA